MDWPAAPRVMAQPCKKKKHSPQQNILTIAMLHHARMPPAQHCDHAFATTHGKPCSVCVGTA